MWGDFQAKGAAREPCFIEKIKIGQYRVEVKSMGSGVRLSGFRS